MRRESVNISEVNFRRLRMLAILASSAIALAGLSGCGPVPGSGGSPTLAPPAIERPTPAVSPATPTPVVVHPVLVSIDAHAITITASDDSVSDTIPFTTELTDAITRLEHSTNVHPVVTVVPATSCEAATQIADFGGLSVTYDSYLDTIGGTRFVATVTSNHLSNGLAVVGPNNSQVGMTLADVLAHSPGSSSGDRGEGSIEAVLDPQEDSLWGVIMTFTAGVSNGYHVPGVFIYGHGSCEAGT